MNDKRRHQRFSSLHLVSYKLFNESNELCAQGVGRTLNISNGGILLDIEDQIDDKIKTVHMEIALDDILVIITGSTAFSRKTDKGYTECGIEFQRISPDDQNMLQNYINAFFSKKAVLLRSDTSSIESVALTLSGEHKIITGYAVTCREMIEKFNADYLAQILATLFEHMENDLNSHFSFEEKILFQAAVSGPSRENGITTIVNRLKSEHAWFMSELGNISVLLKSMVKSRKQIDSEITDRIEDFMEKLKSHAKTEMKDVFRIIDSDQEKLGIVNRLLK